MASFEVGCFFPYSEIEVDPALMRGFAQSVEAMGYDYLANADHVIGVNRASRPDWPGHYDVTERFYDPLMLFSHLAAVTQRIKFISSVIVAPQRQTVLLAQQAANLDVDESAVGDSAECCNLPRSGSAPGSRHQHHLIPSEQSQRRVDVLDLAGRIWTPGNQLPQGHLGQPLWAVAVAPSPVVTHGRESGAGRRPQSQSVCARSV